jgi:anti-sigma regulatory factor (Ser/Thr protein kinase)/CheY-like chemotaxis protein
MSYTKHANRILIVGRSAEERDLLRLSLKAQWPNSEILEAEDCESSLYVIEHQMPDLVLTDLAPSDSTSLGLLQALQRKHSLIPTVVISADDCAMSAVEALQAGAASYVPKSKVEQLLVSTVRTVLELTETYRNRRRIINCMCSLDMCFELNNDLSLVSSLVRYLEDQIGSLRLIDEQDLIRVGVALYESISNAVNHGNLELDSELRQEDERIYYELGEARKLMWPYCDRKVQIYASLNSDRVKFVIRDQGPGFNTSQVADPRDSENVTRIGGRGLLLIKSFMDDVRHNHRGNEITMTKYTSAGRRLMAELHDSVLGGPCEKETEDLKVVRFDKEPAEVAGLA